MESKEYRTIDKSKWGDGEWQNEPDKMQYADKATGLPCLIVRNHSGALCGYVGVSESHPYFGKGYSDIDGDIEAHGGLTFADRCHPSTDESRGICHTPGEGEPDHVWWFGFDCAHSGDMCPSFAEHGIRRSDFESYKTIPYVQRQIQILARQLAARA